MACVFFRDDLECSGTVQVPCLDGNENLAAEICSCRLHKDFHGPHGSPVLLQSRQSSLAVQYNEGHLFSTTLTTSCCSFLEMKYREPNFTLRRTFKVENTGQLQINVKTMEISGYTCEGYGFKVVNCHEFALSANASKDIVIL